MSFAFQTCNFESPVAVDSAELAWKPEWSGLRARLVAARDEALSRVCTGPARGGSFDDSLARLIATYDNGLAAVNPSVLGNGKPIGDIQAAAADTSSIGGRG